MADENLLKIIQQQPRAFHNKRSHASFLEDFARSPVAEPKSERYRPESVSGSVSQVSKFQSLSHQVRFFVPMDQIMLRKKIYSFNQSKKKAFTALHLGGAFKFPH